MAHLIWTPEQRAEFQAKLAAESSILEAPAFTYIVAPYGRDETKSADSLQVCTYRHVVAFLDNNQELSEQFMMLACDWFSGEVRARQVRETKISAREYARLLVEHKNIIKAEDAALAKSKEAKQ